MFAVGAFDLYQGAIVSSAPLRVVSFVPTSPRIPTAAADGVRDEVAELAARIAASPQATSATIQYLSAMSVWRRTPALVNKVMSQGPRARLALYLLYFHLAADPSDASSRATLARLFEACDRRKEASHTAIRAMLGLMQLGGYIATERLPGPRAAKVYRPLPPFVDMIRDMFCRSFSAFDLIFPGAGWERKAREDFQFFRNVYITCGKPFVDGEAMVTERFPVLHELLALDGGFVVLASYALSEIRGEPFATTVALHKEFGVSRTQGWRITQRAQQHGLLDVAGNGRVHRAEALAQLFHRYVATEMAFYASGMGVAMPDEHTPPARFGTG